MTRTLSAATAGALPLEITADDVELHLSVEVADVDTAHLEITGPGEAVERATARAAGATWGLDVRSTAPAATAAGGAGRVGGATVITGATGPVHVQAGTVVTTSGIVTTGGVTVVNGTVVTAGAAPEPVSVRAVLPRGSQLITDITAGAVAAHGHLARVDHTGHNTSLEADSVGELAADTHNGAVHVGRADGEIDVATHNGMVFVGATGTRTRAATHNGPVDITAATDGPINATTHNGPITIRLGGHAPRLRTRTHNGPEHIR